MEEEKRFKVTNNSNVFFLGEGESLPERFTHVPTIVEGIEESWDGFLSLEVMKEKQDQVECNLIDLSTNEDILVQQSKERVKMKDYFDKRTKNSLLYCTEVYVREMFPDGSRPYPAIFKNNWYITDRPGPLESIFLGNRGTYGILHDDNPLGFAWFYVLSGLKRMVLFPPESESKLKNAFGELKNIFFDVDIDNDVANKIKECNGEVCFVHPKQLVIIPYGWHHQV